MNKKTFFLLLALLTLNLTACSDSTEETTQVETATPNNYVAEASDTVISGEVTSIAGNYVTLALGTVEENDNNDGAAESGGSADEAGAASGEAPSGDMPSGDMPDFSSGEMPDFSGGEMPSGDMPSGGQGGGRSSATITKSGEEGSYIIPVGMTVDGLSGRSSDYSGITVGTILTLTVSEDGTVRAATAE